MGSDTGIVGTGEFHSEIVDCEGSSGVEMAGSSDDVESRAIRRWIFGGMAPMSNGSGRAVSEFTNRKLPLDIGAMPPKILAMHNCRFAFVG